MELTRHHIFENTSYNYEMKEGDKVLQIFYAGNLDLYFVLATKQIMENENISLSFDITKENYDLYVLFDALYKEIKEGKVFEDARQISCLLDEKDYKKTEEYKRLVHGDIIEWISDDGPRDAEDRMTIEPQEDSYRLTFYRNDKPLDIGWKSHFGITIRIRNSGSSYAPFNCVFMRLYQRLQNIDPKYQQISIEEYTYMQKVKHKNPQ